MISLPFRAGDREMIVLPAVMLLPSYRFKLPALQCQRLLLAPGRSPPILLCARSNPRDRLAIVRGAAGALAMLGPYYSGVF